MSLTTFQAFLRSVHPALLILSVFGVSASQAAIIRFQSEMHTGNNLMAFYNHSTSQQEITKIVVELGPGAHFDPQDTSFSLGSTSASRTITVGHFTPTWTANSPNAAVGFIGSLAASFAVGGKKATFNFNDFDPGEAWGVFVDIDPTGGTGDAAGSAMNGLKLSVTYAGGVTMTTSCTDFYYTLGVDECHPATFNGNKKSFPSANSGIVPNIVYTPEPMTGMMLGSGLAMGAVLWQRRRRAQGGFQSVTGQE